MTRSEGVYEAGKGWLKREGEPETKGTAVAIVDDGDEGTDDD
jgi:hypothetical protein